MGLFNLFRPPAPVVTTRQEPPTTGLRKPESSVVTTRIAPEQNPVVTTRQETTMDLHTTSPVVTTRQEATTNLHTMPTVVTTRMMQSLKQAEVPVLPSSARAEAQERLLFLNLVRERQMQGLSAQAAVLQVAVQCKDQFRVLLSSGQRGKAQLTYNNYRNWKRLLKPGSNSEESLLALAPKYKTGTRGSKAGDAKFWEELCKFYLHPNHAELSKCWRIACSLLKKRDPQAVVPTITQAYYYIKSLPTEVVVRGRDGETAWKNSCCDYILRDWSDTQPGELLIGDSRTFDTRVRVLNADGKWIAVRPTIAALMDARSWYLAGWEITVEPVNATTLIRVLASYCLNNGNQPPAMCYFDNGKDYCAQGFARPIEVDGYGHCIFNELGIQLKNAEAFNARAKTVERFFMGMMKSFDKRFPDYLGSNPLQRTDEASYFDAHPEELPTLDVFTKIFRAWLDETHATPKSGRIHRGKSPAEIWQTRPQRPAFSDEALAFAFLRPIGMRQVGRGPAVQINGELYYTDEVSYGAKVLVKTNPWDPSMVLLCAPNGTPLGIARTREAVKAIAGDDEAQQTLLRERMARQRHQASRVMSQLKSLTGGQYGVSVIEYLLTLGTNPRFVHRDAILKIKGKDHHFRRLAPADPVFAAENPVPVKPALSSEDMAAIAEADAVLSKNSKLKLTDDVSDDELAAVNQIISKSKKEEGEEDDVY